MTVYPMCGHVPMEEYPERFLEDVTSFVEGVHAKPDEKQRKISQHMHGLEQIS